MTLYVFTIVFSLFFIFFVIELVRRGKLREQYSLLWLAVGILMFVFSASKKLLAWIAGLFGVYYAPSLLFLFGLIGAFALLLHITVVISKHTDRIIRLTQELAITQSRVSELEQALAKQQAFAPPVNPSLEHGTQHLGDSVSNSFLELSTGGES